jgi:hypothetical protein
MANLVREHRLIDSTKRSLVKIVFIGDGTAVANTVLVDASTLRGALNANGYIMATNTHPKSTYDFSIKRIHGQLSANVGAFVKLQWHGAQNSEIAAIGAGPFDFNGEASGDSFLIPNPETGSNGDILYSTGNLPAGAVLTMFIDLKKNNRDYDAGQTADPAAFNRGTWGQI